MNYFRGNGGCGMSAAPEYKRETENSVLDQSIQNENVSSHLIQVKENSNQYDYYQVTD